MEMETTQTLISSPIGVLAVLAAVAAFFFLLAQLTDAKLFKFLPPLLFIYATPVFLSNLTIAGHNVIPNKSIIYTGLSQYVLPVFIVLMLGCHLLMMRGHEPAHHTQPTQGDDDAKSRH